MPGRIRGRASCGIGVAAVVAASAVVATTAYPGAFGAETVAVRLTSGEAGSPPLGDGVALIMGPSSMPTPPQSYLDAANTLYLEQLGFTGVPQAQTTIELPTDTDLSMGIGARQLTQGIEAQLADHHVDAANPIVVFGYSQSAALTTLAMNQLHADKVPSDLVHFVLIGDSEAPNGGILNSFNFLPGQTTSIPSLDLTLGNPTPDDLYPTDVYTLEYDGYADFPRYPTNLLSDLNAVMGMFWEHEEYLGLSQKQIADAIPLDVTDGSLAHYNIIPSEYLPILEPLMLTPVIGKPLYDLLEPDMRILVNLGYGSIDSGWNDGPANVATPVGLFPTDLDWAQVSASLLSGAQKGISDMTADLANPDTYKLTPIVDNPVLTPLITAAYNAGYIDNPHPANLFDLLESVHGSVTSPSDGESVSQLFNDVVGAFSQPVNFEYLLGLIGL